VCWCGEQRSPGEESENLSPVNDEENNAAAELLLVEDGPEFWQCISQNAPGPSGTVHPQNVQLHNVQQKVQLQNVQLQNVQVTPVTDTTSPVRNQGKCPVYFRQILLPAKMLIYGKKIFLQKCSLFLIFLISYNLTFILRQIWHTAKTKMQ
jgi:hypothetical protein